MNKTTAIVVIVLAVVVCLAGGFFAGMQYQKSQRSSLAGGYGVGAGGQFVRRFGGQNGQNFMPVRGQVLSISGSTMTVKLANGNSQLVVLAPSTQYVKSAQAASSDVAAGTTVMVIGMKNSDGSVTAQDVQINPTGMRLFGPTATPTQ